MSHARIVVIDRSTTENHAALERWVAAIDAQVRYHVCPAWSTHRVPVELGEVVLDGDWPVYLLDNADVAGALGYHDVDPHGNPYGRVFTKTTRADGLTVSSVISHEVIEAVVDPHVNMWAENPHDGKLYALEACDPVESDNYIYRGVEVSNFVWPEYFELPTSAVRFDERKKLRAPFTMSAGGYLIVRAGGRVTQVFADNSRRRKVRGSRTVRRIDGSPSV